MRNFHFLWACRSFFIVSATFYFTVNLTQKRANLAISLDFCSNKFLKTISAWNLAFESLLNSIKLSFLYTFWTSREKFFINIVLIGPKKRYKNFFDPKFTGNLTWFRNKTPWSSKKAVFFGVFYRNSIFFLNSHLPGKISRIDKISHMNCSPIPVLLFQSSIFFCLRNTFGNLHRIHLISRSLRHHQPNAY